MEIREVTTQMPAVADLSGLQTFPVTDVIAEIQGGDVIILAGEERIAGQVNWTHFCRIPASALLKVFPIFQKAALLAMTVAASAADGPTLTH